MNHIEARRGGYRISTDPNDFDVTAIHAFLKTSYWALGIPREIVEKAIAGSLCFGLFLDAAQVGFCRVVTDGATYAYLMDVYVLEEHRGRGLGVWLLETVMAHPYLQGLRKFTLATRDAHGFYERFGFRIAARPRMLMEIANPDVYTHAQHPQGSSMRQPRRR